MRIVEINAVNRGSTGRIMRGIADLARAKGHDVLICYPSSRENLASYKDGDYVIGNRFSRNIGRFLSSRFKAEHVVHVISTYLLLKRIQKFKPNVVHLHNLHDSFLNLPIFFHYIRMSGIRVVWTMHDCWLMTGHCGYYVDFDCEKWKKGCESCNFFNTYPKSCYDDSKYKYNLKKRLLLSLGDKLTLAPVSSWLANEVTKSYLKGISCLPVSNGVNEQVFKPLLDNSIRQKYGIPDGKIIMAAGTAWGKIKGLFDFYTLSSMLSSNEYIILVGLPDELMFNLPKGIIGIKRTDNLEELAMLYSIADVVLSLSYRETFGMTIIEANACGTPVVVYDNTAQPELVSEENGVVVKTGDVKAVYEAVKTVLKTNKDEWKERCRRKVVSKYTEAISYQGYIDLFEKNR